MKTNWLKVFWVCFASGLFPWIAIALFMCFNRYEEMGEFFIPFGIIAWGMAGLVANLLSSLVISILFSAGKKAHIWWVILAVVVYILVVYKLLY